MSFDNACIALQLSRSLGLSEKIANQKRKKIIKRYFYEH